LTGRELRRTAVNFVDNTQSLRDRIEDPARAEVIVVRAGGGMFFGPFAATMTGEPPDRWRTLAYTGHALLLRKDAHTLELVTPNDKSVYPGGTGNLFRAPSEPLRTGDVVRVPGMRASVLETGSIGPVRVRFTFDTDLDSPNLVWTSEDAHGFHPAEVPKIGHGVPFDP
jgi:hypothetical protein